MISQGYNKRYFTSSTSETHCEMHSDFNPDKKVKHIFNCYFLSLSQSSWCYGWDIYRGNTKSIKQKLDYKFIP